MARDEGNKAGDKTARGSREVAPYIHVVGGDDVVVAAPDALLEEVGENCMIATHGVSDIKTFGRVCAQVVATFLLLRPRARRSRRPPTNTSEQIN